MRLPNAIFLLSWLNNTCAYAWKRLPIRRISENSAREKRRENTSRVVLRVHRVSCVYYYLFAFFSFIYFWPALLSLEEITDSSQGTNVVEYQWNHKLDLRRFDDFIIKDFADASGKFKIPGLNWIETFELAWILASGGGDWNSGKTWPCCSPVHYSTSSSQASSFFTLIFKNSDFFLIFCFAFVFAVYLKFWITRQTFVWRKISSLKLKVKSLYFT